MSRIQIPLEAITSRLNFGDRFQGLRSGSLSSRFSNLRPVGEFLDFKRLSKPANFPEMQSRVNYNLSHFSSNYAVIFVMLSLYALLTNWLLLFDIIFVVIGMWFIGRLDGHDLEIGNFRASTSQLYTGLVVIAVPLGLIASPFATLLWLIGASGVTILGGLGGRPRAPEFAPQWGRPSRRRRKRTGDAAPGGRRDGDVRVEELDSDDEHETDTQGFGVSSGAATRFVSDPLRFTGIDLGNPERGVVRRGNYQDSEDDEDESGSSSSEDEEFREYIAELAVRDREEALVQSAMHRIEKAKARGRTDVDLNNEELAALERRRKRMEEEAERKKRSGKSGKSSKKRRDQRVAVPLTHLEPTSRKKKAPPVSHQPRQDSRPRHSSSNSNLGEDQDRQAHPPMGYFPPPATSGRPRSGTSSQRPPSRVRDGREGSSFRAPSTSRHPSDTSAGARRPSSRSLDPFQFQVAAAQQMSPMASSRKQFSGSTHVAHAAQRGVGSPATARSRQNSRQDSLDYGTSEDESEASEESSDEDEEQEETSSDDVGSGAQIREMPRGRAPAVVEVDPEPEPEPEPPLRRPVYQATLNSTATDALAVTYLAPASALAGFIPVERSPN
ncbi:hypothetical protein FZEAL_3980 [Fusarium zealandicum]|uniref:Prenylated Rab acceptor 1 n=1 Tax=Fusarium zealandicum TaxID=1053134 RepID=A0A8H4UML9_9HYPO|nr:hypothetical protein FZEAL_3980 [Fusarium zealandicum]